VERQVSKRREAQGVHGARGYQKLGEPFQFELQTVPESLFSRAICEERFALRRARESAEEYGTVRKVIIF
jgi:hypothetical protein